MILTNLVILLNSVYGTCDLTSRTKLTDEVQDWMDRPGLNDCGSDMDGTSLTRH